MEERKKVVMNGRQFGKWLAFSLAAGVFFSRVANPYSFDVEAIKKSTWDKEKVNRERRKALGSIGNRKRSRWL